MKLLYSDLKKFIPNLTTPAKDVGQFFTLSGLMLVGLEKVKLNGREDWLMDLEVRQNRPDCLGVLGLAREVASYYGLPLKLPNNKKINKSGQPLAIKIDANKEVRRVLAVKLRLQNRLSPNWLKEWLEFYGLNSVNLAVDLSNYVMLAAGYPSHLLDATKLSGALTWRLNRQPVKFTTLGQEELALQNNELVIADDRQILALAGLIGGVVAAVEESTTEVILEMALYDPALIMKNSRSAGVVTEAGNRLSKQLSAVDLELAFNWLISLLVEHTQAEAISKIFVYYPHPEKTKTIALDLAKPSRLAGVEIKPTAVVKILKQLRCQVIGVGDKVKVTPPLDRTDLELEEDLIEEAIRFYGYQNIPIDRLPGFPATPDITAPIYWTKEIIRDFLIANGFDEILSQPLVSRESNEQTNYLPWQIITTQNSVNEEFPDLRQSLAGGLINQVREYQKKNVVNIKIFEIGKVFGQTGGKYLEHDALGVWQSGGSINDLKNCLLGLLRFLNAPLISFSAIAKPATANPHVAFIVKADDSEIGIIYKTKETVPETGCFAEIDLAKLQTLLIKADNRATVEITQKLVALDANITVADISELSKILAETAKKIGGHLWSLAIIDTYELPNKTRCTLRATYQELSDQQAKQLHKKIFN